MSQELSTIHHRPSPFQIDYPPAAIRFPNQPSTINHPTSKSEAVAKDFESVLLTRLFDQVQKSMGTWELDEDGTSQQVQGMFWFYLAQEAADKGGLGLWKDIYEHLRQMDGAQNVTGLIDEEL